MLATDLSDLPPAYVAVAGSDPLRDEGEAFVNSTGIGRTGREALLEACGALRMGVSAGL